MVLLLQLSIKQELKLSEPAVYIKKDKKAIKDLTMCPKKKKRKQRSPAKVNSICGIYIFLKYQGQFWKFNHTCVLFYPLCRFSASMTMAHWSYQTQSVTSVLTVMLRSERTTIYRGMSSFTLVWITLACIKICKTCCCEIRYVDSRGSFSHQRKLKTKNNWFSYMLLKT